MKNNNRNAIKNVQPKLVEEESDLTKNLTQIWINLTNDVNYKINSLIELYNNNKNMNLTSLNQLIRYFTIFRNKLDFDIIQNIFKMSFEILDKCPVENKNNKLSIQTLKANIIRTFYNISTDNNEIPIISDENIIKIIKTFNDINSFDNTIQLNYLNKFIAVGLFNGDTNKDLEVNIRQQLELRAKMTVKNKIEIEDKIAKLREKMENITKLKALLNSLQNLNGSSDLNTEIQKGKGK